MPIARPESSDARAIAHVDMDCFYVQVEQRRRPELKGLPTAVVQYNAWQGGGLIAVGYEARSFGVKRSMRGDEAKKVCPEIHLVQVPVARGKADLNIYRSAGSEVVAILSQRGRCERASIDEVYLDLTDAATTMLSESPPEVLESINDEALKSHVLGIDKNGKEEGAHVKEWICSSDATHQDRLLACGGIIVGELRLLVLKETGFTCSAGIAHNKMLAKLASAMNKPAQQTVVPFSAVSELLASFPIKKMKQLGGKLGSSLQADLGVNTVGDLLQFSEDNLQEHYGINTGTWLWNTARGINGDEVEGRLLPKSHGCGKTFPGSQALKAMPSVERWINNLCEELSERIESDKEQNNRFAHTLVLHATVYKTSESDSFKKFPSRSCPLRYGAAKLQEDALKLFNSGLREFLGSFRADPHGNQNNAWGVTALSVTATKILATPGTCSILKYFHGRDLSLAPEEHIGSEITQDALLPSDSGTETCSGGNTIELPKESTHEEAKSEFSFDRDGRRMDKWNNNKGSILRFFHSRDPSCSSAEHACSEVIQDSIQPLPSGADNCIESNQAEEQEIVVKSVSHGLCQDEKRKASSILRFFSTQSPSCSSSQHVLHGQDSGPLSTPASESRPGCNQAEPQNENLQGETKLHSSQPSREQGNQKWSFNVDEIDPSVINELPPEIQDEVRGWLKPPKRANTAKRGPSIAHYFLPTRGT